MSLNPITKNHSTLSMLYLKIYLYPSSYIQKNYSQLTDYMPIIGQGISTVLEDSRITLSESNISLIYGLGFRTLTQNPNQAE